MPKILRLNFFGGLGLYRLIIVFIYSHSLLYRYFLFMRELLISIKVYWSYLCSTTNTGSWMAASLLIFLQDFHLSMCMTLPLTDPPRPLHAVLWGLSIVLSFVILLPNTPWLCARKCYGDIKMSPQLRWSHTLTQLWGHPCPHNSATARAHTHTHTHTHTQTCKHRQTGSSHCSSFVYTLTFSQHLSYVLYTFGKRGPFSNWGPYCSFCYKSPVWMPKQTHTHTNL